MWQRSWCFCCYGLLYALSFHAFCVEHSEYVSGVLSYKRLINCGSAECNNIKYTDFFGLEVQCKQISKSFTVSALRLMWPCGALSCAALKRGVCLHSFMQSFLDSEHSEQTPLKTYLERVMMDEMMQRIRRRIRSCSRSCEALLQRSPQIDHLPRTSASASRNRGAGSNDVRPR